MKLIYSSASQRDLAETIAFIAEDNPEAAERLAQRLDEAVAQLLRFPELGVPIPGSLRAMTVPRTQFRIVYAKRGEDLHILRVWHGARGWPPGSD